jgi:hypothetical protein
MQSYSQENNTITHNFPKPTAQLRPIFSRRSALMNMNLQLQAELDALIEDNKQLRAALAIYSEVARRSPVLQPVCGQVA